MRISDFFPQSGHTEWIQGVEANLLRQRRLGNTGGISLMVIGAAIQLMVLLFENVSLRDMAVSVQNFGKYLIGLLPGAESTVSYVPVYEIIGLIILLAGIGFIFISRHTRFLMKETTEPFRYTFWIDEFKPVNESNSSVKQSATDNKSGSVSGDEKPGHTFDSHSSLLKHDLMERLNQRIGRFSLLDLPDISNETATGQTLSAHIHINGYYAIRENKKGEWVIQVMPRIRIGPTGNSSKLSFPVKFALKPGEQELPPERYNQLVERVYSSVATEIYQQIELDVKKKMEMFPTQYLRAVALSNEARDYMRSNTVDAYDHAIELYKEALEYFQANDSNWKKYLLIPFLWRFRVKSLHARAAVEIGYAECLIYRRQVSALTGQYHNPLFEIPANLSGVINYLGRLHHLMIPGAKPPFFYSQDSYMNGNIKEDRLQSLFAYFEYPADTNLRRLLLRPSKALFLKQARIRFEACLVISLAYYYLGAIRPAKNFLLNAKAIHPARSESDALYLLTAANIESGLDERLLLLRKTSEIAPDFEIALFMLAQTAEMAFRREDEIKPERAQRIIKKYEDVLKINPGNIAALSSLGYVLWLVGLKGEAIRYLQEGCEAKAIVRQTFTGHLNYGLARIYAEEGDFQACYDLYMEAISTDPGVGVYIGSTLDSATSSSDNAGQKSNSSTEVSLAARPIVTPYYNHIGSGMLNRFKAYVNTVKGKYNDVKKRTGQKKNSNSDLTTFNKTLNVVLSFVLNDYANACLNFYLADTSGRRQYLEEAITCYEEAIETDPKNKTAYFNLHQAYSLRGKSGDTELSLACLHKAEKTGPTWLPVLVASIEWGLKQKINLRNEKITLKIKEENKLKETPKNGDLRASKEPDNKGGNMPAGTDNSNVDSVRQIERQIEKLRTEIEELEIQINSVAKEFERVLERTKLSFLDFHNQKPQDFKLPDPAAAGKILNEIDLTALIIWLDITLSSDKHKSEDVSKKLCEYLQKFYPGQYNYHYLYGNMHYNDENYDKALPCYLKASELEGEKNHWYLNLVGNTYFGMQNFIKALEFYEKAIKLNDRIPIYHCNCGQAYGRLKEWEKMVAKCKKAVELRKEAKTDFYMLDYYYEFLAEALFMANRWNTTAIGFIDSDDLNNGQKARLNNRLGNLFFERNDYLNAIPYYEKAISYEPNIPIYHCNLGRAFGNLIVPDYSKMLKHCKKAASLRKTYEGDELGLDYYFEYLAEAHFRAGKLDTFLQSFETDAGLIEREKASVYIKIGQLYQSENQTETAIEYSLKAIELDPHNANYFNSLGNIYFRDKLFKQAADCYQKAVYLEPGNAVYHSNLGLAYTDLKQWEDAEIAVLEAINLDSENDLYQNDMGNIYYRDNRYQDAADCYQKAIYLKSDNAVYHSNLGLAYTNMELWDDAEKAIKEAVKLDPKNANYQNDLGNIYYRSGYFDKAVQYYRQAVTLDQTNEVYKSNLNLASGQMPGTLEDV